MKKVTRDKQLREILNNNSNKALLFKVIFNNRILPLKTRLETATKMRKANKFPAVKPNTDTKKYLSQRRNYCLVTGRARGVLPTWKVSRIVFKSNADLGLIPGIRGASW